MSALKPKSHGQPQAGSSSSAVLRDAGLKVTKIRAAILDLLASKHGPFTTQEVYEQVVLGKPKDAVACDVVTIYRCLSKFENARLVRRCDFGDGLIRYELNLSEHHHHHIICRLCKHIEPLLKCPVEDSSLKIPKLGFKDVSHRLEFFGVCPNCHEA